MPCIMYIIYTDYLGSNNPFPSNPYYKTLPHSVNYIQSRDCFGSFMTNPQADTSMIFIYDAHTLGATPWDTVRKKYMILKRFDLTYDSLVKLNWTVIYK